jgi:hypothetical protein
VEASIYVQWHQQCLVLGEGRETNHDAGARERKKEKKRVKVDTRERVERNGNQLQNETFR